MRDVSGPDYRMVLCHLSALLGVTSLTLVCPQTRSSRGMRDSQWPNCEVVFAFAVYTWTDPLSPVSETEQSSCC
ncbi:hypothetical protein Sros01_74560 [Streptomyces roseochromogenus]|nr:hypothetical protein Sros01_74560 [Streptomyces roseochromogenus]